MISTPAKATIRHYSIVQAESQIAASGDVANLPIAGQGAGGTGLSTTYTGTISANRTTTGITFLNTVLDPTTVDADVSGTWKPGVGGGAGSAPGDYGGKINLGTTNFAIRDLVGTFLSSEIPVSSGGFDLSSILFSFIGNSAFDYSYDIFLVGSGSGRQSLVGSDFTSGLTGSGTISAANFVEKLTIPVNVTIPFEDLNGIAALDGQLTLTGQVVATAILPMTPGDFNGDGNVDGADFVAWQTHFPTASGATLAEGDANGDGAVDGADFVIWQTHFPSSGAAGAAPVPEPATGMLLLVGALAAWRRKRSSGARRKH
ncbi:MAG: PEP-CTERM sorting domain-containing protein [Pirellulales bacterium]|nr:PEP-CTERM sorting domain-containing protein [Pirellulales bacterium]